MDALKLAMNCWDFCRNMGRRPPQLMLECDIQPNIRVELRRGLRAQAHTTIRAFAGAFLCLSVAMQACTAAAVQFPQRFVYVDGKNRTVVVLKKGGAAEYSERTSRPDGTVWTFVAKSAKWSLCHSSEANAPASAVDELSGKCIQLSVSGDDEGHPATFVFQYMHEGSRIREFDKQGFGKILKSQGNDSSNAEVN